MPDQETTIGEAITGAVDALALGMPLGWVLVVEAIDRDGERILHRYWSDGLTPWQFQGYLTNALSEGQWTKTNHRQLSLLGEIAGRPAFSNYRSTGKSAT